jgi:hypothetical protein
MLTVITRAMSRDNSTIAIGRRMSWLGQLFLQHFVVSSHIENAKLLENNAADAASQKIRLLPRR